MILKNKKSLLNSNGFTIVELLVVIVVIGILASITMVSYTGITLKATAATLQSDLKNASTQLEIDKTINGTYPATAEAANGGRGLQPSPGTTFDYTYNSGDNSYSLLATKSGTSYHLTSVDQIPTLGELPSAPASLSWGKVSTGRYHTCSLGNNQIYCWGYGGYGQIGNNTEIDSLIPVAVDNTGILNGKTVTSISNGDYHTCAIADDKAYCWGSNNDGQIGDNGLFYISVTAPVAVDVAGVLAGKIVTTISTGPKQTCAVASGQAYCWGYNWYGQLGDNSKIDRTLPVAVNTAGLLGGKTVTSISSSDNHTCAIADTQVYCWGYNWYGQFGNNTKVDSLVPAATSTSGVLGSKIVTAISTGYDYTCAVASGKAYCWGENWTGELGDGTTNSSLVPVAVDTTGVLSGKTVTAISTGDDHTCAIADNQAYCWGYNEFGQIGNNSTATESLVPAAVDTTGVLNGKTVTAISVGESYSCAIADGQAYCWGYNGYGQFGDNTIIDSLVPVAVDTTGI